MFELLFRKAARSFGIALVMWLRRAWLRKAFALGATFFDKETAPPSGVTLRTKDWCSRQKPLANYKEIIPESRAPRRPPRTIEPQVHWKFRAISERRFPATFLAQVPSGRVVGAPGFVMTPDGQILADVSKEWFFTPNQHSLFFKVKLPPLQKLSGTTVTLAAISGGTYFHWLTDVLPRLALLEKAGIRLADVDRFIVNDSRAPFLRKTLDLLGIPEKKRVFTSARFHAQCETLLVPSMPGPSGQCPQWAIAFLRETFFPKIERGSAPQRIYISRQRSRYRRLLNEAPVRDLLLSRGFREVFLEELPFIKQVELFASASAVVAPHGAGLTNLAFCSPGTKVLELFSPNYVNECFWDLAEETRLDYHYLLGEGKQPAENADPHRVEEDIRVDCEKLRRTLDAAGLK